MRFFLKFVLFTIWLFVLFSTKLVFAQDYKFSLFNQNRTYFNPAFAGMEKGVITTNFIYRRQWLNFPGEFSTKHCNVDWKSYSSNGFGVFLLSDIEGESLLTTNSFGGHYSWRGDLDKYSGAFFQLGLSASYNEKKIDISRLTFSDQLDEIYGKIYGSSFVADQNKRNYIDFSLGGLVNFRTEGIFGNAATHTIGLALHHFTRPNESFQGQKEKLPMRFTFHVQSEYLTKMYSFNRKSKFSITPWLLYEKRGESVLNSKAANNLNIGVDFASDPLVGGFSYKSHLNEGTGENYHALVFKAGTRIYGNNKNIIYKLFYAYELSINNYTRYTRNSHEIGLSVDILFKRRYKCINTF
ncbi:PorP/SprF family type IX secretion system membrane protein [Marinifilum sp. RC60d5]|uniref:PorP/SprF family type IX secretion system membrane protein n=1 Tax=Marinifilum sp. RC60d5 TaxID=3458414 RepID=UPI0040373342